MKQEACTSCAKVFHWDHGNLFGGRPASDGKFGYLCPDCGYRKEQADRQASFLRNEQEERKRQESERQYQANLRASKPEEARKAYRASDAFRKEDEMLRKHFGYDVSQGLRSRDRPASSAPPPTDPQVATAELFDPSAPKRTLPIRLRWVVLALVLCGAYWLLRR
jgi:uncharacterized Zn finger protein (UPF0148 family)